MEKKPEPLKFRTQAQVDKLKRPAGKPEAWAFDEGCTGLSIRLKGKKSTWVVWLPSVGGKRPKMTLTDVVSLSLAEARIKCGRIRGDAKDGKSPLEARRLAKVKAAELTFGELVKVYIKERAEPRQRARTLAETKRYLERYWKPLHDRPLSAVTSEDIDARVHEILHEHGPSTGAKARTYLNMAFSWAMRQPRLRVKINPVAATEAPEVDVENGRALPLVELAVIWRACEGRGKFGGIVRLLMLLGARRTEVSALPRTEFDLDQAMWRLPADRCKNGRAMLKRGQSEHEVPLPRQAVALLRAEDDSEQLGPFVFGRHGRSPFSGFSRAKEQLDVAIAQLRAKDAGHDPEKVDLKEWMLPAWSLHDLRTSMVTHSADLGLAPPHVIEAAINHLGGHRAGVAGRYNFALYREPKRAALQAWSDWLEATVEGREPASNVVGIQRGAA